MIIGFAPAPFFLNVMVLPNAVFAFNKTLPKSNLRVSVSEYPAATFMVTFPTMPYLFRVSTAFFIEAKFLQDAPPLGI